MAAYTMQLKVLIEQATQYDDENLSVRQKIEEGRKKLFDFSYPIFDEDYRAVFETNLIRKFYIREIGFETEGLFKFQLDSWLNLNMPYFNELFESEALDYDPLTNAQMVTAHQQDNAIDKNEKRVTDQQNVLDGLNNSTNNQDSTGSSNTKGKQDATGSGVSTDDTFSRNVHSDNPDSRLNLTTQDGKGVIEFASKIDENIGTGKGTTTSKDNQTSSSDTTSKSNVKTTSKDTTHVDSTTDQKDVFESKVGEVENYLQRRYGKIGSDSYAKLVQEYRGALLRIEVQIHKELQQLFMMVY